MTVPIRFPHEADVIYEEAQRYRRLSSSERLTAIFDLIAAGMRMMDESPHREAGRRLRKEAEAEWRRAHKELFAKHGF